MNFSSIHNVYFIGIGGIGMSALARYFKAHGKVVVGYDKTATELTRTLEKEGIPVHYEDLGETVLRGLGKDNTVVIFTPAVPKDHRELNAFAAAEFTIIKRARALGIISSGFETYAVAGTHGKTTTSTMLAHVLNTTPEKCNAFIGGISANYHSNFIINPASRKVVVEADEFDRSFLQLHPDHAIVTSMDADHLDIYGDGGHFRQSFIDFINQVKPPGFVMVQADLDLSGETIVPQVIRYGFSENAAWKAKNERYESGRFYFDITRSQKDYPGIELGIPGRHNAENATAVFGLCMELGIDEHTIREALASFRGVQRRFDFQVRRDDMVVIDDYAHHPTEIEAFLSSVRKLYPGKKITAVFQPHLFSRTRDFMDGFARSLALCDELYLLDIYPAREEPIPGITSRALLDGIDLAQKAMSSKENIVADLKSKPREVIVIIGAGDIDTCVQPIKQAYE